MARSAPIASAVRSVSWHCVAPMDIATILGSDPSFKFHCFFNRNFIKGIHGHFDVGSFNAGLICFDANFTL
jgi:hypothetical protein